MPRIYSVTPLKDRLLRHICPDPTTGCWNWTASLGTTGYGQLNDGGRVLKTHRVAYEVLVGPIPCGLWVLHKCDNRPCCNPDHLFLGDRDDNMKDCAQKGRSGKKLDPCQVRQIRNDTRLDRLIAEDYGVSAAMISMIQRRTWWKEIH